MPLQTISQRDSLSLLMDSFPIFIEDGHYISRIIARGGAILFVCLTKDGTYETHTMKNNIMERCDIADDLKDEFVAWWRDAHS